MGRGPDALRGADELVRVVAQIRDQFGDARRLDLVRIDEQRVGNLRHDDDRREGVRIESELWIEALVDDERRRRGQQSVAIRLGAEGRLRADVAGGAGAVLDHDRHPPFARQPLPHDARNDVRGAPGGEGDDDLDRVVGISLSARRPVKTGRQHEQKRQCQPISDGSS
jgi:hypothetical protein